VETPSTPVITLLRAAGTENLLVAGVPLGSLELLDPSVHGPDPEFWLERFPAEFTRDRVSSARTAQIALLVPELVDQAALLATWACWSGLAGYPVTVYVGVHPVDLAALTSGWGVEIGPAADKDGPAWAVIGSPDAEPPSPGDTVRVSVNPSDAEFLGSLSDQQLSTLVSAKRVLWVPPAQLGPVELLRGVGVLAGLRAWNRLPWVRVADQDLELELWRRTGLSLRRIVFTETAAPEDLVDPAPPDPRLRWLEEQRRSLAVGEVLARLGLESRTDEEGQVFWSCPYHEAHPHGDRNPSLLQVSDELVQCPKHHPEPVNVLVLLAEAFGFTPDEVGFVFSCPPDHPVWSRLASGLAARTGPGNVS